MRSSKSVRPTSPAFHDGARPAMLRIWVEAARPKTLLVSVCAVVMGTAIAFRDGAAHLPSAVAALIGALAIQIGTNYANDYFDARQGADTAERKGPRRAVQAGLVTPAAMLQATLIAFGIAAIMTILLVMRAGWPLAVVGGISVLCGIGYTASRFSLAYLGLGDVFVLVFFGPVAVAGACYVQTLAAPWNAAVAGLAPGFLSVGILVVNNLRDIQQDAHAGKRTLAVRFGDGFARGEYLACMLLAAGIPVVLHLGLGWGAPILLASLAILPGVALVRGIGRTSGAALNPYLGRTAALLLLYTGVFSLACPWA